MPGTSIKQVKPKHKSLPALEIPEVNSSETFVATMMMIIVLIISVLIIGSFSKKLKVFCLGLMAVRSLEK